VAEYKGIVTKEFPDGKPLRIINPKWGVILAKAFSVGQTNLDFAKKSLYTIYMTPTNPIPYVGAIKLVYPDNVILDA